MNYTKATNEQLYTIAYHEPCSRMIKLQALMELERRRSRVYRETEMRIRRGRG